MMRYVVRYFRDAMQEPAEATTPILFLIIKQQAEPSGERVWQLVRKHAARHGWVPRGEGEGVRILEGEAAAARDLLGVTVPGGDPAVLCMKMRD